MTTGWLIWDFDGTLAELPGLWSGTLAEVVQRDVGVGAVTAEAFRPWLQTGFPWHAPHVARDPSSADADEWWNVLAPVLVHALIRGAGIDGHTAAQLLPAVRTTYCDPTRWRVFDDAGEALQRLADQGWQHLLLSNHVPELRQIMTSLGLADFFEAMFVSAETGLEKPNPAAFALATASLPKGSRRIMIGDSYEADIFGARRCGLDAVLVRRAYAGESRFAESLAEIDSQLR